MLASCNYKNDSTGVSGSGDKSWLEEITISELQKGYHDKKFTVTGVVTAFLERIEEIDKKGPVLNSIICVNPDALAISARLDSMNPEKRINLPLFGVPVVIKDNIDTHDRMPNTAGATALRNSYPTADSHVARKLREAGAVIIGKSNLSEWANFRATVSSSGWSGLGGQTRNPYILDRNPCGSSSGSGVSVSANLCVLAIGTETNGSIVCPANNNGIVGIKPTVGLISRSGIIPISFSQDTPGPMARTVEDAAICLGALIGIDPADPKTADSEGKYPSRYIEYLNPDGLKGKRLGIFKGSGPFPEAVDSLFSKAVRQIRTLGAEVIEISDDMGKGYEEASFEVMLFEFKDGLNRYLAKLGQNSPVRNLTELIEFNKNDPVELEYFNQELLVEANKKGDLGSAEYKEALQKMITATREQGIDRIIDKHDLDALIAPTGTPAWKTDMVLGDHFTGSSSSPAAISGYPSISVPMGQVRGLPVGISFFGKAWSEPTLIAIAYSYEQATKHRQAPRFIPTD